MTEVLQMQCAVTMPACMGLLLLQLLRSGHHRRQELGQVRALRVSRCDAPPPCGLGVAAGASCVWMRVGSTWHPCRAMPLTCRGMALIAAWLALAL